jgi:RimJ/RimL family protein N-acetyltransferase
MLSGELVGLRALERADLPQLLAWRNAPQLRRFFRERHELAMEDQLAWFQRVSEQRGRPRDTLMLAIESLAEHELIGACGLCYIDWVSATAEVSLYIGAGLAYAEGAFALDAGRTLIDHAFDELNLRRLWVEVYAFDMAKRALLETLGFMLEGVLREHRFHAGAYHDSLVYGLLRDAARHSSTSRSPNVGSRG